MALTVDKLQERAREALPYFAEGWGEPGDPIIPTDISEAEGVPHWIQKIDWAARQELGVDATGKHFYGLVAETLLDLIEYDEVEEDPEEVCDEVARSFSIPALNEEIFEWMKEARDWSDTVRELADDRATDVNQEHQLISEAMGNEIYNLRREVLFTLYGLLIDKFE
ncbi:MAG: hypothetical protein ACQEP7_03250 [bacterium]